ncbi:CD226 antigen [Haplochromis burtoni]|uniref:CD226 antigen n=1 Tax=Haplochromis burtoni TaxID=8153 RepID=UPI0006C9BCFD|nr:CD226 antigen [Haplochromis burtoni]
MALAVPLWFLVFEAFALEADTDVKVSPGQDATLYCQSPRGVSVTLLEWSKPELKSEYYVFFFQNQRSYENYQHKFFKGRVELSDPSMKDGIASVILRNVSIIDTGMYMCQITTSNTTNGERVIKEFKHYVNLTVTESGTCEDPGSKILNNLETGQRRPTETSIN